MKRIWIALGIAAAAFGVLLAYTWLSLRGMA